MNQDISHVLLTRFNLPTPGVESLVRAQEGWLRDRQQLFERYCLPSVQAQTSKNFRWIVYFDTESPAWLRTRVAELNADGTFVPIYRRSVPHDALVSDIREVVGEASQILATTNLDNDDALSSDFVCRVQSAIQGPSRAAIYVTHGLISEGERLFVRRDPANAFCTVSESWDEPFTCWADWHNRLARHMPVLQVAGRPGWLQVVHGGNVSNRVRGIRVNPEEYSSVFPRGLEGVAIPRLGQIWTDRFVASPLRFMRDSARNNLKRAIFRLGGKQGLDRVKLVIARARRSYGGQM